MGNTSKNELLWERRPVLEMTRLAWPIGLSMISYAMATLIDTLFVSPLGADALAGVSLGGVLAFTCISFALGALRGIKVSASQLIGAGKFEQAVHIRHAGVRLCVALGVTTALVAFAISFVLEDATQSPAAGEAAGTYLGIRALGMPMVLMYAALREYRQATGDSFRPMMAAVSGNLLNIALDYVFIVVLGWGVAGAAWATSLSHVFEMFLILALVRKAHRWEATEHGPVSSIDRQRALGKVWQMGWPLGLQFVLESSSFTVMALLLAGLDSIHLAAHQIVLQVVHMTFLPLVAIADAASVLAGQALGAGRLLLIRRIARYALWMGLGYAVFCTVVLVFTNAELVAIFTDEPALSALVSQVFWIAAAFQILDAVDITTRGVLRGVGDVRFSAASGVICAWLTLPPGTYILGYMLGWGVVGGWASLGINIVISAAIMRWRLQSGRWRERANPNVRPWSRVRYARGGLPVATRR